MNYLYYGDNLDILRRYIKDESIDLIYLDPPFKSNQAYNILFKERNGTESAAQIRAFEDTWHWDRKAEETYIEIVENLPKKVADLIRALRGFLGTNDMMAYLVMMAIRLQELHRVLKPTGSMYLHCDPTASHYLKLVMDAIFGGKNFRNEIIWHYGQRTMHNPKKWNAKHDNLLFYAKTDKTKLNVLTIPWTREEISKRRARKIHRDEKGEYIWDNRSVSKGFPPKKQYIKDIIKKGKAIDNVWDIPMILSTSRERLGYPTQKPERLLEQIIKASSNERNIVLDPFCGCGTTIAVAEKLERKWVGIDITHLAISLMRHRLEDTFGTEVRYTVVGEPVDLKGAEELAKQDPYQFQWWALGLVGARPAESEQKKGADKGIDGYIYFHDDPKKKETKEVILQVKSGNTNVSDIRDLRGVVKREEAQIAVFITLREPTKPMQVEAVSSGYYRSPLGHNYPKIQILTIKELLEGKKISRPLEATGIDATFKKAKRYKRKQGEQKEMF